MSDEINVDDLLDQATDGSLLTTDEMEAAAQELAKGRPEIAIARVLVVLMADHVLQRKHIAHISEDLHALKSRTAGTVLAEAQGLLRRLRELPDERLSDLSTAIQQADRLVETLIRRERG